jgi:hypothetical protein
MGSRWSAEEEDFLREASSSCSIKQMAETLDRTPKAVFYRCQYLGLTPVDGRRSGQPKEAKKPPRFRIDDGGRECSKCSAYKPWSEYHTGNGAQKRNSQCMTCEAAYHYDHWRADLEGNRERARLAEERHRDKVNPGRQRFVPCIQDEDGRECPKCRAYKPWVEFHHFASGSGRGDAWVCKPCWRESVRKSRYLRVYGITVEEFEELERQQGGVCALCEEPEDRRHQQSGELFYLSIDHDHTCDRGHLPERACRYCIRGLTCYSCNAMLGWAERRAVIAVRFSDYLVRRPLLEEVTAHDA